MKKLALLLLMAATFMPIHGNAQEFYKRINSTIHQDALVVNKFRWDWIICNNHPDDKFFTRVDETGSAFSRLIFPKEMTVKDMKVYKDTLYFCGAILNLNTNDSNGIFGYFPLGTNVGGPLTYMNIYEAKTLDKLDIGNVFSVDYTHRVMVGKTLQGLGIMVDIRTSPFSSWSYSYGLFDDFLCRLDDITFTLNHIVISGVDYRADESFLMFFDNTFLPDNPFFHFNNPIIKTLHSFSNNHPILLKKFTLDTLVAAYIEGGKLHISGFAGTSRFGSKEIAVKDSDRLLKIANRLGSNEFHLLLKEVNNDSTRSTILHMTTSQLVSGTTVTAHTYKTNYNNDYVSDIDYSNPTETGLSLVGQFTSEVMFGKLNPHVFEHCYESLTKTLIQPEYVEKELFAKCRDFIFVYRPVEPTIKKDEVTVTQKCPGYPTETEEN